jgi:hypothetical protein
VPKPWTAIDWSAQRPNERQIARSHGKLRYAPVAVDGVATQRILDELRRVLSNGGALLAGFQVEDDDEVCHWFSSRNRFGEYGFFRHFLESPGLRATLPELVSGGIAPWVREADLFEESFTGAYTLDGWLARILTSGGAYGRFTGTAGQAKQLGVDVSRELVAERFDEFVIYESHQPWSGWFGGVASDTTVVAIDLAFRRVYLLALTDTD